MDDKLLFIIIFSGIWILLGLIFFIIGMVMRKKYKKKITECTSKTFGKIIDIVKRSSSDGDGYSSYNYYPVIEYMVGDMKFIKEYNIGNSSPKYGIGQNLEIYFNPEDYNEYYIGGDEMPTVFSTVFIFAGIACMFIGIAAAVIVNLL